MPARPSRSVLWGAAILFAVAGPAASAPSAGLHPSAVTVSPGPAVVTGTVVTVTATLTTGFGMVSLGRLRARDMTAASACDDAGTNSGVTGITGDYEVDADNPALTGGLLASSTCVDFLNAAGTSRTISWSFTAQATGGVVGVHTVHFSVLVHDDVGNGVSSTTMGCSDPNGCYAATMFTGTGDLCSIASVDIVTPGVSVTLTVDPDGPGATYGAVADTVVDPLSLDEVLVSATLTNPSGTSALTVDPALTLPQYFVLASARTPAGPVSIPASGSQVFAWSLVPDPALNWCQDDNPESLLVSVGDAMLAADFDALGGSASAAPPVSAMLDVPDVVSVGASITATLYLTNLLSRPVVIGGSATPYLGPAGTSLVTAVGGPTPAPPTAIGAGATVPVRFAFTAAATGTQNWSGGISISEVVPCLTASNAPQTQIIGPSPVVASLTVSTTTVDQNQPYQLLVTAFNSSLTCSVSIDSFLPLAGGSPPFSTLPPFYDNTPTLLSMTGCGGLPCAVAPGATVYMNWSASARDCYTGLRWGGTLTGTNGCGGTFIKPLKSAPVTILSPAAFVATASLLQPTVLESQTAYVAVTVTPNSFNAATVFAISAGLSADPGASIWLASAPAVPTVLAGCGTCVASPCAAAAQTFTWGFLALTKSQSGRVAFTFTVAGQDPVNGAPFSVVATTPKLQILHPSTLQATASIIPSGGPGCEFDEGPVVYVSGDTAVDVLWFTFTTTGGGSAGLVSGPAAPTVMAANTFYDNEFAWTFSPVGTGCIGFTFSIAGWEEGLGATVYASTVSGTTCEPITAAVASLHPGLSATTTSDAPGQTVTVTFTLSDSGSIRLASVAASATPWIVTCGSGSGAATLLSSLLPNSAGGVGGCGDQMFWRWIFHPTAAGDAAFTMTVTGVDQQTLAPFTVNATTACLHILDEPPLALSLIAAAPTATRGGSFPVTLSVTNTGGSNLWVSFASSSFQYSSIGVGVKAGQSATILAGSSKTITVSLFVASDYATSFVDFSLTTTGMTVRDLSVGGPTTYPTAVPGFAAVDIVHVPVSVDLAGGSLTLRRGDVVDLTLIVRNPGTTTVLVGPTASPLVFNRAGYTMSSVSVTVTPGGTASVPVHVTVASDAPFGETDAVVGGAFTAVDQSVFSTPLAVTAGGTRVALNILPDTELLTIADNPYHVLKGGLPVTVNLPAASHVRLELYTLTGDKVVGLVNDELAAGEHVFIWDGKTVKGDVAASGIYLLRYESQDSKVTRKLAVVK